MEKILVVYWSGTGNTQKMAEAIAEGAKVAGAEATLTEVGKISVQEALEFDRIAIGCPSMGAEVLEEAEMEPFFTELEANIVNKNIALFGSYGWGDGEWMRDWESRVKKAGANLCNGEGTICNEAPDADAISACKQLASNLLNM